MTTTAERPVTLSVGDVITSSAQLLALPDGAQINCPARFGVETRQGNQFVSESGNTRHYTSIGVTSFTYHVHYLPTQEEESEPVILATSEEPQPEPEPETDPRVGQPVTERETYHTLPVGSVVYSTRTDIRYTKQPNGTYRNESSGGTRSADRMGVGGHITIESIPPLSTAYLTDMDVETPDIPPAGDTFTRYIQRFWTVTFGQAQRAGVSLDPIHRAMEKLGVERITPAPGAAVDGSDYETFSLIPSGSILTYGDDPSAWGRFGLFGVQGGSLMWLLGGITSAAGQVVHIVKMEGITEKPEWVTEPTSLEEIARIEEFKAKAWEVGLKAKRDNSWCGDYETAMRRMGITGAEAERLTLPTVTAEAAAALPDGTILRYAVGNTEDSVIYRRDDRSTNPAKTVRIGGSMPGAWRPDGMTVEWNPADGQPLAISIRSTREMDGMPVGTVIGEDHGGTWTKGAEGGNEYQWTASNRYPYDSSRFTIGSGLKYRRFPA